MLEGKKYQLVLLAVCSCLFGMFLSHSAASFFESSSASLLSTSHSSKKCKQENEDEFRTLSDLLEEATDQMQVLVDFVQDLEKQKNGSVAMLSSCQAELRILGAPTGDNNETKDGAGETQGGNQ